MRDARLNVQAPSWQPDTVRLTRFSRSGIACVRGVQLFEITSALTINQLCLNWATSVERLDQQGMTAAEIDARGRWFSNAAATAEGPARITDYCGTAAGVLHQRGKPPNVP